MSRTLSAIVVVLALLVAACSSDTGLEAQSSQPTVQPATPTPSAVPDTTPAPLPSPTEPPGEASPDPAAAPQPEPDDAPAEPTPTPAPPTPTPDPFVPSPLSWNQCSFGQCATMDVPLDHSDPQGPTIELALSRVPASGNRLGVLLLNPGGPGAGALRWSQIIASSDSALGSRFDIVTFDPRGVGFSSPLSCAGGFEDFYLLDSDPDTAAEQQDLEDAARQLALDCQESDGDLLPHLGTDSVVDDMDLIRQALGEEQLNFLGLSYGTMIGALYADKYGPNVRALVLDGVVDPSFDLQQWLTGQARATEATLDSVFAACGNICGSTSGAEAYDTLLAATEQGELPGTRTPALTPANALHAALTVTYQPTQRAGFLEAVVAMDGPTIDQLGDGYLQWEGWAPYTAVTCVDSPHPVGADAFAEFVRDIEEVAPRFGADIANELLPCAFWPVTETRQPTAVHAPGAPPILVVGNTGDTATPFINAQAMAENLETGVLLTHEGVGHTSYLDNDCVDNVIRSYLIDLEMPAEGSICR